MSYWKNETCEYCQGKIVEQIIDTPRGQVLFLAFSIDFSLHSTHTLIHTVARNKT